ncbi:MAG: UDP-3-O-acyl-N-acetylglucosamine deacetylase, partial [Pseudomonadota bacterium]
MGIWQSTLAKAVTLSGIGVHSGKAVTITLRPAAPNTGVVFQSAEKTEQLPAIIARLADTELAVTIGTKDSLNVSTIEHLMATFSGLGVDNVLVEIHGNEVPILDGSAMPIVEAIDEAGIMAQSAPRRVIEVLKPVRIDNGHQWAELTPYDGFAVDIDIDFRHAAINRQRLVLDITPQNFRKEIASARTFGFMQDAVRLRAAGFGLGASTHNTVILSEDGVLN